MKFSTRQVVLAVGAGTAVLLAGMGMTGRAVAQTKAPPATKGPTYTSVANSRTPAGQYFKAVNTSTLKGLSVDDFLQAMGVMTAGLGFDCSDCHPGAGSDNVNWVFDTQKKITARKMVEMVATINKTNFGGAQMVTCWTCHHGRQVPTTSITLDHLYGPPYDEKDDLILPGKGVPTAAQTLDKYIAAVGGASKLAGLKSFIATGTATGYEKLGGGGTFQIMAQSPDKRSTTVTFKDHPERGDNTRAYDGKNGWIRTPRGLFTDYEIVGVELNGARADAMLSFPGQIKTALTGARSGFTDSIDEKSVEVVQGSVGAELVTLYFDQKTGLLTRMVRFGNTPAGRSPTQMDFADYRDVGGIKFPFKYSFLWLDGRDSFTISDVKVNVPIDASKFGKPK